MKTIIIFALILGTSLAMPHSDEDRHGRGGFGRGGGHRNRRNSGLLGLINLQESPPSQQNYKLQREYVGGPYYGVGDGGSLYSRSGGSSYSSSGSSSSGSASGSGSYYSSGSSSSGSVKGSSGGVSKGSKGGLGTYYYGSGGSSAGSASSASAGSSRGYSSKSGSSSGRIGRYNSPQYVIDDELQVNQKKEYNLLGVQY